MKLKSALFLVLIYLNINAQTPVTIVPIYATENDSIIVYFDASKGNAGLKGFTGDVYAHTGVITNLSIDGHDWKYVMAGWGSNYSDIKLTRDATDQYHLVIGKPRIYYSNNHQSLGTISPTEHIIKLAFVFRDATGNRTGRDVGSQDIFVPLYSSGISIVLNTPIVNLNYGDPMRSPVFATPGTTLPISVSITQNGTITLFINGTQVTQSSANSLIYNFNPDNYPVGRNDVKILAADNANHKDSTLFVIMKNPSIVDLPLPAGNQIGINYGSDPTKVTLAFYAPKKSFVYVVGDFGTSDWKVDQSYFMNRYEPKTDSVIWWTTISNLEAGKEYSYQFLVDGNLRIYDPYTEKILDGNNDSYIPASVYPNLKVYPTGKTSSLVSVLQTNQPAYSWQVPQFIRPAKEKLVIYEMLVRDFVSTHWYRTITDSLSYFKNLGITAIELMPVMEFEGNDSWGYNPTTYFAPDKYYGTKNDLKAFIDACHQNGIAVILDIVLNHAYGSNSMAQLYWDSVNNKPLNNPWFNTDPPTGSYSWGGIDFNHESKDTRYFVERVTNFWLTEYKVDGFRFDFSKGFTNTPGEGTAYDPARIAILKRIANKIWNTASGAYVILEHFCANSEEMELANYGMMLWGNLNYNYNEATMGYISTSNFNNVAYNQRGWTVPNIVGYMESHDEQRLMYKNLNYGKSNSSYNVTNLTTALSRMQMAASLFILVPGPKMIWQFGETGYDYSIDYNGRVGVKPIRWDYYFNTDRRNLYYTFAYLNKLKNNYPAFSSSDFNLTASLSVKSLYINHSSMNVAVFGNFDIVPLDYQAQFQSIGTWYEFFTGNTLSVSDVNMNINLQPGEFRLYTSQRINKSDIPMGVETDEKIPNEFTLSQNYPNPFNPSTTIKYTIPSVETRHASSLQQHVTLKVFDLLGREIATLVNDVKPAGVHSIQFNASELPSGVYIYRIQAGEWSLSKKMIFIK